MDRSLITDPQRRALHRLMQQPDFQTFLSILDTDYERQIQNLLITDTDKAGRLQGYCYALKQIRTVLDRIQSSPTR